MLDLIIKCVEIRSVLIMRVKHNIICTIENNVIVHIAKNLSLVLLRVNKRDFVVNRKIRAETFLCYT